MFLPQPFGLLNIDKPQGKTSRDVVNAVQRLCRGHWRLKGIKVGHAGTLDPLATGVLVVCIGPATRLVEHLQAGMKIYRARFRLGCTSDTDDVTGEVHAKADVEPIPLDRLTEESAKFVGTILQVPPQFSAVHVDGKRAYDLARVGNRPTLTAREVVVHRIEILDYAFPDVELLIACGSGTYIRSLARDLGEKLGCGAIMTALARESVGSFSIDEAVPLNDITPETVESHLISPLAAVAHLPRFVCTEREASDLVQGRAINVMESSITTVDEASSMTIETETAIVSEADELWGIADFDRDAQSLKPKLMFLRRE